MNTVKNKQRKTSLQSGFTLLEMSIYLLIVGVFVAAALDIFRQNIIDRANGQTEVAEVVVRNALSNYVAEFGALPCPADPSLSPTDAPPAGSPQPGISFCPGGTANTCTGQICRTTGGRDTAGDAEGFLPDPVLVGAVPYVTLGIDLRETIDGWGGKLTYAVSEFMTDPADFNENWGVINRLVLQPDATDPSILILNSTRNPSVPDPLGSDDGEISAFPITVVSHGPDNKGAYNYEGRLIAPCTGTARDVENCDGDNTFIAADRITGIYSLANNDEFFDDGFAFFDISRDSDKWAYVSADDINNKANGNIGIGTTTPDFPLHVDGNILVSDEVRALTYCNESGQDCFNPNIIGGSGISCNGGLITGISNSNVICVNQIDVTDITPRTCPDDEFVKGINAAGELICEP